MLFVCTANQCRSPMAEALLRSVLSARGIEGVRVSSAGLLEGGMPATAHARTVVGGLDDHVSRRLVAELVADADVVITMERRHLREVAVLDPWAFDRTFTLRGLVRAAERAGPRSGGWEEWLSRVGDGRRPGDYVADDPADEIADPIGGPLAGYERTAAELRSLLERLVELAWPRGAAE